MIKAKQPPKIKRIAMTQEGFDALQKELSDLKKERPQAVKNLSEARNMGDLSENGLYTAAKSRLRSIDSQLFRLDIQIKLADIVQKNTKGIIDINSKVTIESKIAKREVIIVGDFEADPINNKISKNSPLGSALIGRKVGEEFDLAIPSGNTHYKIISVS